ncbi:MAG: hypothetical protein KMY53_12070 [Desulfarculus sp.]|nr:hypothetical protein [Pseudomonadota bacterium]MBU4600182.1 hypothetical protein [Pseudomonadota bacterium]MBV1718064.1 hypothetical protein [Desulfarculus sp.]MBV1738895.1 hypothetical protein [Desulfarculus sp.]
MGKIKQKKMEVVSKIRDGEVVLYKRVGSSKIQGRFRDKDNKWVLFSTKTTKINEATEIAGAKYDEYQFEREFKKKYNIPDKPIKTFTEVADELIKEMKSTIRLKYRDRILKGVKLRSIRVSLNDYISMLDNWYKPYFKDTPITEITRIETKSYYNHLKTKMGKIPSKSTVSHHNACLNKLMKFAANKGYISWSDIPRLDNEGYQSSARPHFDKTEWKRLVAMLPKWCNQTEIEVTQGLKGGKTATFNKPLDEHAIQIRKMLREFVLICANSGLRPFIETNGLKWKHLTMIENKKDKSIFIRFMVKGKDKSGYAIGTMGIETYLKRIRDNDKELKGKPLKELFKIDRYVFQLPDGTLPGKYGLIKPFKKFLIHCSLLNDIDGNVRTLYSLRHTYAIFRLYQGVDVYLLSRNMRTSVEMIQKFYGKIDVVIKAGELADKSFSDEVVEKLKKGVDSHLENLVK